MKNLLLVLLLITTSASQAQEHFTHELQATLKQAELTGKKAIVVFGNQHCAWCKVLQDYHSSAGVSAILNRYFIIYKIDVLESDSGSKLFKQYSLRGVPAWVILDENGRLLVNGKDEAGKIIGYPFKEIEVQYYTHALKQTSNIEDKELEILWEQLRYFGNKYMAKTK